MYKVSKTKVLSSKTSPASRVRQRTERNTSITGEYVAKFLRELRLLTKSAETSIDYSLQTYTSIARRLKGNKELNENYYLKTTVIDGVELITDQYQEIDAIKELIRKNSLSRLREKGNDAIPTLFDIFNRIVDVAEEVQLRLLAPILECFEILKRYETGPEDLEVIVEVNQLIEGLDRMNIAANLPSNRVNLGEIT